MRDCGETRTESSFSQTNRMRPLRGPTGADSVYMYTLCAPVGEKKLPTGTQGEKKQNSSYGGNVIQYLNP